MLVGLWAVLEQARLRVVEQLALHPHRRRAEHQPLRVGAGDGEVGARRRAALAGANPVTLVAGRAGEERGREGVVRPTGSGQKAHAPAAAAGAQVTLAPGEDAIVSAALLGTAAALAPGARRTRSGRPRRAGSPPACPSGPAAPDVRRADLRPSVRDLPRFFHGHARRSIGIAAVLLVPVHGDGRHLPARAELVLDGEEVGERGRRERILLDALDADERLGTELQRPVGRAEDVDAPVTDQAAAEIVEPAPVERQVVAELAVGAHAPARASRRPRALRRGPRPCQRHRWRTARAASGDEFGVLLVARGEGTEFRAAQPEVPGQGFGHRRRGRRLGHALRPARPPHPRVDLLHLADFARPDDLGRDTRRLVGVPLVAHLRGHLVLLRGLGEQAGLRRDPRERLLHVDALAALHAEDGGDGVHVIGRPDYHRVDVLPFLVEHLAEVLVLRRLVVPLEPGTAALPVHVGERDDVLRLAAAKIVERLPAGTDTRDVEFLVRRLVTKGLEGGHAAEAACGDRSCEKRPEEEEGPSRDPVVRHALALRSL